MTTTQTTNSTSLIPVEKQEKIQKALEFFTSLREIKFTNQAEYDRGTELCKQIKAEIKTLEDDRTALVKPFNEKVNVINGTYKDVRSKLENAERVLKSGMSAFFQEQERKRIEAQKKLEAEAEAKRKAEEERAEKERQKAEQYRAEGREDMAAKAEARAETAEAVASTTVAPVVQNTAKVQGVTYKTVYKVIVEDQARAIVFCATNPMLSQYVTLDVKGLERVALAMKGKLTCEGLKVIEDKQVVVRS